MLSSSSLRTANEITSLAIGKFDGMHLAHLSLLKNLDFLGALLCIQTKESPCLTPMKTKELYTKYPIFYLKLEEIKDLSGEQFTQLLQTYFPCLKKLVVGYDFRFGKNRSFEASDLQFLLSNTQIVICEEFCVSDIGVHSSLIKEFIALGNCKMANALLGRTYSIIGKSVRGQGIGSKQLFATINLQTQDYLLPQHGVYATFCKILESESCTAQDSLLQSVSFIGNRLSTDRSFSIEVHIIDRVLTSNPLKLEVFFLQKIRDNKHFKNLLDLRGQIESDIHTAKSILNKEHS
ncbi:MAG: bifunctional riboflavin kinase/FAD synthetase [Helicobacter sp.]|nr:bifunctional riboflavin kinase/FAD synthetase [Helicobacter sp.]MCI7485168.1 bifunctional riboflavin kinase/FAD synthetase [Helicobacter sp.]